MKKNDLMVYLLLSFSILIPVPGRLAYGLILILEINFIFILGILFRRLISLFVPEDLQSILISIFLVFIATLFKQFVIMYSPIIGFVLGFLIYLPVFSSFIFGNLQDKDIIKNNSLGSELKKYMSKCGIFSLFAFIFYFFRDIISYGTLTLPSPSGVFELFRIKDFSLSFLGTFFASIPGAILSIALLYFIFSFVLNKINLLKTANEVKN